MFKIETLASAFVHVGWKSCVVGEGNTVLATEARISVENTLLTRLKQSTKKNKVERERVGCYAKDWL